MTNEFEYVIGIIFFLSLGHKQCDSALKFPSITPSLPVYFLILLPSVSNYSPGAYSAQRIKRVFSSLAPRCKMFFLRLEVPLMTAVSMLLVPESSSVLLFCLQCWRLGSHAWCLLSVPHTGCPCSTLWWVVEPKSSTEMDLHQDTCSYLCQNFHLRGRIP